MTLEEFYGEHLQHLNEIREYVLDKISNYKENNNPLEYCISRIKDPISMQNKLIIQGYNPTVNNALTKVFDAIGVRTIFSFIDGIYDFIDWVDQQEEWEVVTKKDYITYPKTSGYRSYHIIIKMNQTYVEIQARTIAMDFWASLEHQIHYKHDIPYEKMIMNELKRCADEIASIDVSMQTIKELIHESNKK